MAVAPYFVVSPNTLLSTIGLLRGGDTTPPTPIGDWRQARVDVVIPALEEEADITLCLASVVRQTLPPRRIVLIDDGSQDHTLEYAQTFCDVNGLELLAVHRRKPIGKTVTIKRQARELDSDVEFILDGDTVLESDDYIARTVEELYQGAGIASACGTILPLRHTDRDALIAEPSMGRFLHAIPDAHVETGNGLVRRLDWGVTNLYRGVLYQLLQRFVYHGQMTFFGTITNPVGCAVAYRREYVEDLFDHYEPLLGDDLTNSEDIFIGFALLNEGYRNIQLTDVTARSREPLAHRLPAQLYLWSSSFLQSCFYFDALLRSPFKAFARYRLHRLHRLHRRQRGARPDGERDESRQRLEKRKVSEPYRQAFGREHTRRYGRPVGWVLLVTAIEKIGFPTAIVIMALLGLWEALAVTVVAEAAVAVTLLVIVSKGQRLEYLFKGILMTPVRYASLLYDLVTIARFATDLWIRRTREWRK